MIHFIRFVLIAVGLFCLFATSMWVVSVLNGETKDGRVFAFHMMCACIFCAAICITGLIGTIAKSRTSGS